jgi:excisionase family DNA binding protein
MSSQTANLDQLHSVPDTAPRLAVSVKGLWGLVARGEIETVKVGRLRRISERAIRDFIERNTCPARRDLV